MAKTKKVEKKKAAPAPNKAKAAKPAKPASRPAAKAAPKPAAKTAAKPAAKPAPKAAAKPAPKVAAKSPAKPVKAMAKIAVKPATTFVVNTEPAAQAPGKFRREYRRWKDVLITLRHRLLQEGSHLEEEGLKALEQEVSVDHMADFGSDSSEQETTLQLIESNSISLRDVDDALKRIEAGTYGLCEECEQLVPPARLEVLPHARFCISCQSKRERTPA